MNNVDPENAPLQGPASVYGGIDSLAEAQMRRAVSLPPATTGARVMSVVLDFAVLKLLTTLVVMVLASGVTVVLLGGAGEEQTVKAATAIAWVLSAMVSAWYFLSSPSRRRGQTIGQRLLGVGPRAQDGGLAPASSVARHHFVVFFVPSLLLVPGFMIGIRDVIVLGAWCLIQCACSRDGRTPFEDAAGISIVSRLP